MFSLSSSQQHNEEPNAFDLTWRNYLPSTSQFCLCLPSLGRQRQGILLDENDNHLIDSPSYYNDFYQGKNNKWKKRSKRRKYPKQRLLPKPNYEQQDEFTDSAYDYHDYDYHQQEPTVYQIHSDEDDHQHQDAVYLEDDEIAKMVNHYDQQQPQNNQEFYAPRTIPFLINDDNDDETTTTNEMPKEQPPPSSPTTAALAAQAILSETLEDLTEKLVYIRNNMMDIGASSTPENHDNQDDTATLHTLKTITKKDSSERLSISSDMDSIASEALLEYENTTQTYDTSTTSNYHNRRFSSNVTSDLVMPVQSSTSSSTYAKDTHPFSYFTEQMDEEDKNNDTQEDNTSISGIQGAVLNFGKKWFG
ncbi:uncharacterized protein BX664DRAFT_37429 [Halteromyces radiatus]|uniref:uncharacterized protein n=1 Tax=Halteromyces radiatus TaxID=101107 RepID=UPI00221F3BF5|nr:uncharacterized protein BX664DRAFT_37429 [Halteromyces radiatus]KAI8078702.1 hypothetical protein BX664DRAFT_37429 [Halteromyces radiatus]